MSLIGTVIGLAAPYLIEKFFSGDEKPKRDVTSRRGSEGPPEYMMPHYQRAADYAGELFRRGYGGEVYYGPRVADLSEQTRQGISDLGTLSQNLQNPYLTQFMSSPMESIGNLRGMASGEQIGKNPHFQQALQNALGTASDLITSQVSGAGRYGSGAHTGILADRLGQMSTQAMSAQYNQDVANMLAANQLMSNTQLGQMGAISSLSEAQNRATMSALAGGGFLDQHEQAKIDARMQRWKEEQQAPWQRLKYYTDAIDKLSGKYKQTTGEESKSYYEPYNPAQSATEWFGKAMKEIPWSQVFKRKTRPVISPQAARAIASGRGGLY